MQTPDFSSYSTSEAADLLIEIVRSCVAPYEHLFKDGDFNFNDPNERFVEENIPPEFLGFDYDTAPTCQITFLAHPFIHIRGTKYESMLISDHLYRGDEGKERDEWVLGYEIDIAENPHFCIELPDDHIWNVFREQDEESCQRIVKCYEAVAEDGVANAYWCLAYIERNSIPETDESFFRKYYYLINGFKSGHLGCLHSLCIELREFLVEEKFKLTYIGATQNELFSLWNLALHYLYGVTVPKSKERAIELYEKILDITTIHPDLEFLELHYNGLSSAVNDLIHETKRNLRILRASGHDWEKYFNIDRVKRYVRAKEQYFEEEDKDLLFSSGEDFFRTNRILDLMGFIPRVSEKQSYQDIEAELHINRIMNENTPIYSAVSQLLDIIESGYKDLVFNKLEYLSIINFQNEAYILRIMALLYMRIGDMNNALECYQDIYDIAPDSFLLAKIFHILYSTGRYEEALDVANKYLRLYDDEKIVWAETILKHTTLEDRLRSFDRLELWLPF